MLQEANCTVVVTDIHDDFEQQHAHIQRLLQRLEADGKEVVLTYWNAEGAVCGNGCALEVPMPTREKRNTSGGGGGGGGGSADGPAGASSACECATASGCVTADAGSKTKRKKKRKDRNTHRHMDAGMAIWRPGRVREAIAKQCQPYDEFAQEFVEGCATIPR
jgi:hypothetical protein